ncbi:uncharacterized protein [Chelonus insularis]|uniref:uncharacterized protein n=1 Tax=Chelonus insularis TaxID=460826 RepID=UPI00158E6E1B|nr:uncharacterized protein LOC118070576 [Chelonus insularis]
MQRVLSFQTGRGGGESTEFVTKRMCCSLIFSVGFLCLLCGFLIGRFAAGRVIEIRIERKKLELDGNGLYYYDHLRNELISNLNNANFDLTFNVTHLRTSKALESVEKSLSGLNIFNEITGNDSCVIATVRGSHEPDRYIVLGVDGPNIVIGISIAKEFQKIYETHEWIPKRTLIFLISTDFMESCLYSLSNYDRSKIVAYLAVDKSPIEEQGVFLMSGSDMVQTTVLEASKDFPDFQNPYNFTNLQRLKVNMPQAVISFNSQINYTNLAENKNFVRTNQINLARVLSNSIWKLSEMTIFQWDPQMLNEVIEVLDQITSQDLQIIREYIKTTVKRIISEGLTLNGKIMNIDRLKSLDIRIMNDFLKDLEQILLCPDETFQSQTDIAALRQKIQSKNVYEYLHNMLKCYQDADKILQDMT